MRKLFPAAILVVMAVAVIYATQGGESGEDYLERIQAERDKTTRFMQRSETSPFAPDSIPFEGLRYYPADPKYRIKARLEPVQQQKLLTLPTTTGEEEKYIRYGYATFTLDGIENKLLVLQPFDSQTELFVAFADATSGEETYGGGRYLNVEMPSRTGQKTLELDFNLAYNPYCAYNPAYSCPLPPKENVLAVPIKVGEKAYGIKN